MKLIPAAGLVLTAFLLSPAVSAGQGSTLQPGQWDTATTIVSVDMPGAPAMASQMMTGRTMNASMCLTREMVSQGNLSKQPSADCTRTKVSFVAGKMAIEMVCKTGKSTMTMTESGTFTPTSYQLDAKTVMSGASSMTQVMKISAKRVGDCKKP